MSNTDYTDEPVCPHCGNEMSDAWELQHEVNEVDCGWCDKPMKVIRHIEVTYSTRPDTPTTGEE